MADNTNGEDSQEPSENNPFAGTPLEQLFGAFAGGNMPDMSQIFGQMQRMFEPHEGPVNFNMAKDIARQALAAAGPDPSPHAGESGAVSDAVQLAEMWLDRVTSLPAGATTSAAWSRAEWIEATAGAWQKLVEPIAENIVGAMGTAMPEEAKAMMGPLMAMLGQAGGAMFGQQVGQALAGLAAEVVSSTDIGIPLTDRRVAAILPTNVKAFSEGLEHAEKDVLLYLALRECAHQRLFQHATWLPSALQNAIEAFGRGTRIDIEGIESSLQNIDPTRPEEIQEAMTSGLFEPEQTPEQKIALDRIEVLLALIEGWVDEVVSRATDQIMPAAASLSEAMRRRRATGGPAEQTFASLIGLELRPRRLREAATLWAALRDRQGPEARDAVWGHPDLMPSGADLDDPLGFAQTEAASDEAFNAALDELLGGDSSDE